MKPTFLILSLFFSAQLFGQQVNPVTNQLDVLESSGLIYTNNRMITINDSGNEPSLYEIDSATGITQRKVFISNASNVDWEDLAYDDDYIYIGDFGNNNGSRTNLRIYRVSMNDYLTTSNDTITADTIKISYAAQTDFTPAYQNNNFDAEALISYQNSLYIFSKNWANDSCYIYPCPKTPGTYSLNRIDSFNSQGLVTAAAHFPGSPNIMLIGYNLTIGELFSIELKNFVAPNFVDSLVDRHTYLIPNLYSTQWEGLCAVSALQYYISAENTLIASASLFRLDTTGFPLGLDVLDQDELLIYPNPSSGLVKPSLPTTEMKLYTMDGKLLLRTKEQELNIEALPQGTYQLILFDHEKNAKTVLLQKK